MNWQGTVFNQCNFLSGEKKQKWKEMFGSQIARTDVFFFSKCRPNNVQFKIKAKEDCRRFHIMSKKLADFLKRFQGNGSSDKTRFFFFISNNNFKVFFTFIPKGKLHVVEHNTTIASSYFH